jgi:2-polyprenyl-6-methoxyphenol hydroxylase-like FAD-dependent oxidoreductase
MTRLPIIIVGGGIGGMCAALALNQMGFSSVVLEQADKFREIGAGIQLCPNVFKMFEVLGIKKIMTEIAVFPNNLIYLDGLTGDVFLKVPLGKEIQSRFNYPYGVYHRQELLQVLINECHQCSLIKLIASSRVIDFEETDESIIVKTAQGTTFKGEALIGADGLWSVIRDKIVGDGKPTFTGHVCYRGVLKVDDVPERLRPNDVYHWVRPEAHLVHYPIGSKGYFNIVAIFSTHRAHSIEDTAGDPEELYEHFADSQPQMLELLSRVDSSRMWMLCDRDPIKEWSRGRIVLIGDAAHPSLPYLTQGAGMAIEDAVVLSRKIFAHNRDYPAAFKSFQKERYLRTGYVQLLSRCYGDIHHLTGVARELRNYLISKRTVQENYDWLAYMYDGIEIHQEKITLTHISGQFHEKI